MRNTYLLGLGGALLATTALAAAAHFFPGAVDTVKHFAAASGMGAMGFSFIGTTLGADKYRSSELGDENHVGAIATDIIYEGALVGDNGSGYGRPLVAADLALGFALQQCDNSTGSAGDKNIRMSIKGELEITIASVAITDVGKAVYASDDDTFTYTASGNSYVGRVKRYVSATRAVVAYDFTRGSFGKAAVTTINYDTSLANSNGTLIATVQNTFSQQQVLNHTVVAALNDILQKLNK